MNALDAELAEAISDRKGRAAVARYSASARRQSLGWLLLGIGLGYSLRLVQSLIEAAF